jgi:hypothetical protein
MMDDPITKISGENFPLQGLEANEAHASADGIGSRREFVTKLEKFFLIIHFKGHCASRAALMYASRIVGFE